MWQPELHKVVRESSVSWQVQAHRDQIPIYPWYGGEGRCEALVHCHRWVGHRCVEGVMIDRLDSSDNEHNRVG